MSGGNASRVHNLQMVQTVTYGPYVMGGTVGGENASNSVPRSLRCAATDCRGERCGCRIPGVGDGNDFWSALRDLSQYCGHPWVRWLPLRRMGAGPNRDCNQTLRSIRWNDAALQAGVSAATSVGCGQFVHNSNPFRHHWPCGNPYIDFGRGRGKLCCCSGAGLLLLEV